MMEVDQTLACKVYDLVGTTWTQVGADINGEAAMIIWNAVSINMRRSNCCG
ncbi:MAG: hypothetical protein CM15mP65_22380 [Crocinitomicaceae bacterium]|nr:MAG: hypothetical protein CM15mP65_22380 [Crocinitomicaceae bacterium]